MTLNNDDLRKIDELIADRLEAEQIVNIFTTMDERQKEILAQSLQGFIRDVRSTQRSPENRYTIRWTQDSADVNTSVSGSSAIADQRGFQNPTLPRWLDQVGGSSWLDPDDPQIVHFRGGGAGADCMFDYLVSECWADEVAAGRGTEGQPFTSLTGCTFRVYSTIQGACTNAATNFTGNNAAVIFICPGWYEEDVTVSSTVWLFGGGNFRDTNEGSSSTVVAGVTINALSESTDVITFAAGASESRLSHVKVSAGGSNAIACIRASSAGSLFIDDVAVQPGSAANFGIWLSSNGNVLHNTHLLGSVGTGIRISSFSGVYNVIDGVTCDNGIDVAVRISDGDTVVRNFLLDAPNVGFLIDSSLSIAHISDGYIHNCTTAIDIDDGTQIKIKGVHFEDNTTGIDIATASDSDIFILNNTFDLDATDTGISFPLAGTNSCSVIDGNVFYDTDSQGTPIANAVGGWSIIGQNWYNGGALYAASLGQGGGLSIFRQERSTNNLIEWDQFYMLWGATLLTVAAGTLALTASATNYIEINSSGTISANTTGFSAGQYPLAVAVTSSTDPTSFTIRAPVLSHSGLASGSSAAPSPHDFVGTHHEHDDDYTQTPNVEGLGVGGGDIDVYSDNGVTQTAEWDSTTGHIAIGGTALSTTALRIVKTMTGAATGIGLALTSSGAGVAPTGVNFAVTKSGAAGGLVVARYTGSLTSASNLDADYVGLEFTLGNTSTGAPVDVNFLSFASAWTGTAPSGVIYGMRLGDIGAAGTPLVKPLYIAAQTGTAVRSFIANALAIGADVAPPNSELLVLTGNQAVRSQNAIRLYDTDNSHYTGFKAHSATTETGEYILPAADGSPGQVLSTDGSFGLSWVTAGGSGGHTIQDDNSAMPARTNLSFQDGFVVTDDAGGDQTEIDVSYAGTGDIADVAYTEAAGSAITVARGDHVHALSANFRQIFLPAERFRPTLSGGCAAPHLIDSGTQDVLVFVCDFDATTDESAVAKFGLPAAYAGGTLSVRFVWMTSSSTTTHTCRWGIRGGFYSDATTLNTALGTEVYVEDNATSTANQVLISDAVTMTLAGAASGRGMVVVRVTRDADHANDDLNVDARLLGIYIDW